MLTTLLLLLSLQPPPAVVGTWRGTSLCLQGKPVCHDETVVYRFTTMPGTDSLALDAFKIVNGVEDDMGVMHCAVAPTRVTCPMPPQFRPGTWWFDRKGNALDGGLTIPGGGQFRKVHVERAPS